MRVFCCCCIFVGFGTRACMARLKVVGESCLICASAVQELRHPTKRLLKDLGVPFLMENGVVQLGELVDKMTKVDRARAKGLWMGLSRERRGL